MSEVQKGKHFSPKTEFKKGVYQGFGFQEGHISQNKGKKFPQFSGKRHWNWKGGIRKGSGYIYVLKPKHPLATKTGYVRRSRLIMEKMLGRYLTRKEVVHHKGTKYPFGSIENKQDDRPKNLQLFVNHSKHMKFHRLNL